MKRVATPWIPAGSCDDKLANIPPSALIQRFVEGNVFTFLGAVFRPVRRHVNPRWSLIPLGLNRPAFLWIADLDLPPQAEILGFVINVQIVNVKAAAVARNLAGTVVTPVVRGIPDDMPVHTGKPNVVIMF